MSDWDSVANLSIYIVHTIVQNLHYIAMSYLEGLSMPYIVG